LDLKPEIKDTEFIFDRTKIVLHYDSIQNTPFPKYTLIIYKDGKMVAGHEGVGFEELFSSKDSRYFLGASNSGLVRDAYVVFDNDGNIVEKQNHEEGGGIIKYCNTSITVIRNWYDSKNPDVKFNAFFGKLWSVSINGCDGKRVSLLK
jgi:hypothetical protein